jgi:type II secretory pathway component PulF
VTSGWPLAALKHKEERMAKFSWEARSRSGSVQKGVMEAPNSMAVEVQLKKCPTGKHKKKVKA